jgi:hypothetical protein
MGRFLFYALAKVGVCAVIADNLPLIQLLFLLHWLLVAYVSRYLYVSQVSKLIVVNFLKTLVRLLETEQRLGYSKITCLLPIIGLSLATSQPKCAASYTTSWR